MHRQAPPHISTPPPHQASHPQVRIQLFYMSREVREAHWADLRDRAPLTTCTTGPLISNRAEIGPIEVSDIEAAVTGACVERSNVLAASIPTRQLDPQPLPAYSPALAHTSKGSEEPTAPPAPESRITRI